MGLFSVFKSSSSMAKDFKKKFTEACEFFFDISYHPSRYPWGTIQTKKIAFMTELADFCRYKVSNPRDEFFTISTNGEDWLVRLNMTTALVIAERYVQALENGIKLSKSISDQIIQDVKNNSNMYEYKQVLEKYT